MERGVSDEQHDISECVVSKLENLKRDHATESKGKAVAAVVENKAQC